MAQRCRHPFAKERNWRKEEGIQWYQPKKDEAMCLSTLIVTVNAKQCYLNHFDVPSAQTVVGKGTHEGSGRNGEERLKTIGVTCALGTQKLASDN